MAVDAEVSSGLDCSGGIFKATNRRPTANAYCCEAVEILMEIEVFLVGEMGSFWKDNWVIDFR